MAETRSVHMMVQRWVDNDEGMVMQRLDVAAKARVLRLTAQVRRRSYKILRWNDTSCSRSASGRSSKRRTSFPALVIVLEACMSTPSNTHTRLVVVNMTFVDIWVCANIRLG